MITTATIGLPYAAWYLGWFDDAKDKSLEEKAHEAKERFVAKFGAEPRVVLMNEKDAGDLLTLGGMRVRPREYVRPNHFWVGSD